MLLLKVLTVLYLVYIINAFTSNRTNIKYLQNDNILDAYETWPNGIIPYVINAKYTYQTIYTLKQAFDEFSKKTCVRFVPRTYQQYYINITDPYIKCMSEIGYRRNGAHRVYLHEVCFNFYGTILHELMHVLGFQHEHTRKDRDKFVEINWENIREEDRSNFLKNENYPPPQVKEPYDFQSILHYHAAAFSMMRSYKTIIPKLNINVSNMGQRDYFSAGDLRKIHTLYNCTTY